MQGETTTMPTCNVSQRIQLRVLFKMEKRCCGRMFFSFLCLSWFLLYNVSSVSSKVTSTSSIELSEENSNDIFEGEWMIMFYAPWCPACKNLKPIWKSFADQWSDDLSISVGLVDINKNPGLSGQFLVFQLPTLFHIKNGAVRPYTGARSQDAFVNWINDKSWRHIDPVEWWKNPNSLQMRAVAYFFRFANFIREVHEQLTEAHNIPTAAVYALFAFVTILTGLLLGMALVVICDCINPPKPLPPVDQRQYSKVEIAKTPVKGSKKSKKEKPKEAAEPADEVPASDDNAGDAASEPADVDASVRKRRPRKE